MDFNFSRGVEEVSVDRRVQTIPALRQSVHDSYAGNDQQTDRGDTSERGVLHIARQKVCAEQWDRHYVGVCTGLLS